MTCEAIIPRRIIQTGRSRDFSPLEKAAATNLQLLHPGWEFQFFDDEDVARFVRTEFPDYVGVFYGFPHRIQRYDFFRYLAVYRLGGFYLDLDVFLSSALEGLREHSCVFPFEELSLSRYLRETHHLDWEIGNYAFGAAAAHPFLAAVISKCVQAQNDPAWVAPMFRGIPRPFRFGFDVLNTTGPGLLTRALAECPQDDEQVTVLFPADDCDICDRQNWHRFGPYGVHAMAGSWRPRQGYVRQRLARYWEESLRRRLAAESRQLRKTSPAGSRSGMHRFQLVPAGPRAGA